MGKTLLTGRAAAKLIGCSYTSVQNLARNGTLEVAARDSNGHNLYDPEAVTKLAGTYVDGRTRAARDAVEANVA